MTDPAIRRVVYFSGRVQGVGFRFATRSLAQNFAVAGAVRNLEDGRVHLVAEGSAAELDRFVAAIREQFGGNIRQVEAHDAPATGEFAGFTIAY